MRRRCGILSPLHRAVHTAASRSIHIFNALDFCRRRCPRRTADTESYLKQHPKRDSCSEMFLSFELRFLYRRRKKTPNSTVSGPHSPMTCRVCGLDATLPPGGGVGTRGDRCPGLLVSGCRISRPDPGDSTFLEEVSSVMLEVQVMASQQLPSVGGFRVHCSGRLLYSGHLMRGEECSKKFRLRASVSRWNKVGRKSVRRRLSIPGTSLHLIQVKMVLLLKG